MTGTRGAATRTLAYGATVLAGLVLWQVVAGRVSGVVLAPPGKVLNEIIAGVFVNGVLLFAFLRSLQHMLLGLAITLVVAVPLGFLMGRNSTLDRLLSPAMSLIYSVPPVAFVPFMVVWFGLGFDARVALVVLMSFFEVLYVVVSGVRSVPGGLLDVGRSFSAKRSVLAAKVLVPASYPVLFTALRIGMVRAVNAMITAELFFAAVNLGKLMKDDAEAFDTAGMLAIVILLALFGLSTQEGLKWVEQRLIPWHIRRPS